MVPSSESSNMMLARNWPPVGLPIMLLTGTAIAAVASFVTLRRYLRV